MRNWPANMTLQSLANLFLGHHIHRGEGRVKYFPDVLIKSLLKRHFLGLILDIFNHSQVCGMMAAPTSLDF